MSRQLTRCKNSFLNNPSLWHSRITPENTAMVNMIVLSQLFSFCRIFVVLYFELPLLFSVYSTQSLDQWEARNQQKHVLG